MDTLVAWFCKICVNSALPGSQVLKKLHLLKVLMVGIGIDFGTSNSVAATFDGQQITLVPLEGAGPIMPTATHLDRKLHTETGQPAIDQYIEENRDRIVELTSEVIAKSTLLTSERNVEDPNSEAETASNLVYGKPNIDRGMPGRLFRGVKRLLGNPDIKRLLVFDHPFRLVALVTPVLLSIRHAITSIGNEGVADVHFGHPIEFEGHDRESNQLALSRLEEAAGYAGLRALKFYPEPVAATLSYFHDIAQDETSPGQGNVLTIDFGGGTLDLCVMSFDRQRSGMPTFQVLSTAGIPLGGDHIDQLIFRQLLFPLLGKGEIWSRISDGRRVESQFPFEEFEERLLNWPVTYTLNQNQYRAKVADCIKQGGAATQKFERLDDLITHNYSYIVFQAIREAKAALSDVEETVLDIPEIDVTIAFTRTMFEEMLTEMLDQIREVLDEAIRRADISDSDVDYVIRTGGSSQIAAVRVLLEERFPRQVTEHDPFTSVAAGLAIANHHGYVFNGD